MDEDPKRVMAHGVTAVSLMHEDGVDRYLAIGFYCEDTDEDFNFVLPWRGAKLLVKDITDEMEEK